MTGALLPQTERPVPGQMRAPGGSGLGRPAAAREFLVFDGDLRASELRDTRHLVTRLIGRELAAENLPAATFGSLDGEDLIVTRTADRSVLGCMNDMTAMCQSAVTNAGGLHKVHLAALSRSLHRNINSARGYQRPVDLAARRAS